MTKPSTLTPEQEDRVRELAAEVIVEMIYLAAFRAAQFAHDAVDWINDGQPFTPPRARRGFGDD